MSTTDLAADSTRLEPLCPYSAATSTPLSVSKADSKKLQAATFLLLGSFRGFDSSLAWPLELGLPQCFED